MKRESIIIFINSLLSGGAERQALLLAINLNDSYNVLLVVYYGDKVEDKYSGIIEKENIKATYLSGNHLNKLFRFYRILKQNNPIIIFSYLLTTNLVGAIIGKIAGVPFRVGGIRNAILEDKKLLIQRFINNYLSTHTLYNNYRGLINLQKKGFDVTHSIVIPNCFEVTSDLILRQDSDIINIITVGRFVPQKGYFEALNAIEILKKEGLQFKYTIIGFGRLEKQIKEAIKQLQLDYHVEVIINPPDINCYYKLSDIYLCSSYFEGLSNTVMEALSFSLPVVATDVGDNDRLVVPGINGFLVAECKSSLFVDPLRKLINSTDLRKKMGIASYQLIKNSYSNLAFKNRYEAFITHIQSRK